MIAIQQSLFFAGYYKIETTVFNKKNIFIGEMIKFECDQQLKIWIRLYQPANEFCKPI